MVKWLSTLVTTAAVAVAANATSQAVFATTRDAETIVAKRLAIIGAGAAGSSAAYFARQYADAIGLPLNITIFESNPYIGGRSTTVNAYDNPSEPVELGASIFVKVNQILYDAAQQFNLTLSDAEVAARPIDTQEEGKSAMLGVWNGEKFVFEAQGDGWWDAAKLFFRYGLSPLRARNLMSATIGKFLKMYDPPMFPFVDLTQTIHELGLAEVVGVTGRDLLRSSGISDGFANELVQASTRVNYAANLEFIHGVETMVCLATDGAMAIRGGNWRIFDKMINEARVDIRLNTSVTSALRGRDGIWRLASKKRSHESAALVAEDSFDSIILAAPYQSTGIDFTPIPQYRPTEIPYVTLHVTLFTSPHRLSAAAFNLESPKQPPVVVLTTLSDGESPGTNTSAVGKPHFFSVSTLRTVINPVTGNAEYLYKIFSPQPASNTSIARLLGTHVRADETFTSEDMTWMYRKEWQSYPEELPRTNFEKLRIDRGLWYTSGIESFISTMETSALMGKNIARLVIDGWAHSNQVPQDEVHNGIHLEM